MKVLHFILLLLIAGTGIPIYCHYETHGVVNWIQCALAFFLWLNVVICYWEISLGLRIDYIADEYEKIKAGERGTRGQVVWDFFNTKVTPFNMCSPTLWAHVWSSYASWDDSYADRKSFGFFADVGNGISTLIPSFILLFGMTHDFLPPRVLGVIGLVFFYQFFYQTSLYFFAYMFNKRYQGLTAAGLIGWVGGTNGFWIVIPLIGIYASLRLIFDNTFAVFL
jgi:hypothetical protein